MSELRAKEETAGDEEMVRRGGGGGEGRECILKIEIMEWSALSRGGGEEVTSIRLSALEMLSQG